jgi:hypothetical protein
VSIKVEFGFAPQGQPVQYNDISQDVVAVAVTRGKDPQQDTFNASSCSVQLNNESRNYDPDYGPSPYQGKIVPTGQVRIYSNEQIVFTGFITDWNFSYSPSGESIAELVASDAFWNLNNQRLIGYEPIEQSSSSRILSVLTRPEVGGTATWPNAARVISPGVATMGDYEVSDGTNALSYLQEIEKAEPGRLFIDKLGRLVFKSRNNDLQNTSFEYFRTNLSPNPSFENNVRGWEATSGTITRSTATAYIGTASGSLSAGGVVEQYFGSNLGDQYTASLYAKSSSGTVPVTIAGLTSFDGLSYNQTDAATIDINSTDWTRINTTFSSLSPFSGIRIGNSTAAIFLDALLIEQTPIVDAYFDGANDPVYNTTDPDAPDYQPERAFETYETDWIIEE